MPNSAAINFQKFQQWLYIVFIKREDRQFAETPQGRRRICSIHFEYDENVRT